MTEKTLVSRTEKIKLPENLEVGEKIVLPITENFSRKEEIYSINTIGNKTYIKTMEENSQEEITTHRNYEIGEKGLKEITIPNYYDNLKRCFIN